MAVYEFSEKDPNGKPKDRLWFPVPEGYAIQALIAHDENGREIHYVETVPTPPELLNKIEHDRWPLIVPK